MPDHRTIKSLVFDYVHRHGGKVDYDSLTAEVLRRFPDSRWKRTHWAWYRSQIVTGRFKKMFSQGEREALAGGRRVPAAAVAAPAASQAEPQPAPGRGRPAKDPEIKRIGDQILDHVRFVVRTVAGDDLDRQFKLNRWVFSRLLQDEVRAKRPIKRALWDSGMRSCQACGQAFASLKGVELHRKDASARYSIDNCEFLCRECHQELD